MLENTRAFSDYGILPELVGRFSRLVPFQPLDREVLKSILEDTLLNHYRNEFRHEGVELVVNEQLDEAVNALQAIFAGLDEQQKTSSDMIKAAAKQLLN